MTTPDEAALREWLAGIDPSAIEQLEVFDRIGSTNTHLREQPAPSPGALRVALADHQTAGRGRHENRWISAPGRSLCLSVAYTFREAPENLPALTLVLGIGAVDALSEVGAEGVRLKWPNDLVVADAKLGGILTETKVGKAGTVVVAGIGINLRLPDRIDDAVAASSLRPVDLASLVHELPTREELAAHVIEHWRAALMHYDEHGFRPFLRRYRTLDWLRGRRVEVRSGESVIAGVVEGVDSDGALQLGTPAGRQSVVSGSIVSAEAPR